MTGEPHSTANLNLVRFAQYVTGLTSQQDVWHEAGKMLVQFFSVDVVGFGRSENGVIMAHSWGFADSAAGQAWRQRLTDRTRVNGAPPPSFPAEVLEAFSETWESGFLALRQLSDPCSLALAFLPVRMKKRENAVMLIGYAGAEPFSKDLLDVHLAVAGLIGTTAERLASEDELQQYRRELEQRVQERTEVLTERMKELDCLYSLSNLMEQTELTEDELLQAAVALIPPAFRHEARTVARITAEGKTFVTPGFQETPQGYYAPIAIKGRAIGVLDVFSRHTSVAPQESPFQQEEEHLIGALARNLGRHLERMRAEQAVRDSEQKLSTLFDSMNEAVILYEMLMDDQGQPFNYRVIDCNRAFTQITGIAREAAVGRLGTDVYQLETAPYLPEFSEVVRTGMPSHFETCFAPINKHFFVSVVTMGGNKLAAVATDITDRKRAEEALLTTNCQLEETTALATEMAEKAQAAAAAKSAFLANMSHEIRTPMNAILGMTHLALRTALTPQQQTYLNNIDAATRSLLGIINDILDFSKIEAGKLHLEQAPFQLPDIIQHVKLVVGFNARNKGLELHTCIDPDVPPCLVGDSLRLGQVLLNLVSNAVKFTDQGSITVLVLQDLHTPDADAAPDHIRLRFSVQDTGLGMTPKQVSELFQPFFQADSSTTRKFGGTGLGLAICQQLVGLMGGVIQVQSAPGQGSTFSFSVTFTLADEALLEGDLEGDTARSSMHEPNAAILAGKKVLVVEDNALNRELVRELLAGMGILVEIAVNGREAVGRVAQEDFDLILMDIQMPEMDGLTATGAIRAYERQRKRGAPTVCNADADGRPPAHLPIIAMTAHAMKGDREKSLAAGMDDHVTKPIEPHELEAALLRWMPKDIRQPAHPAEIGGSDSSTMGPDSMGPASMGPTIIDPASGTSAPAAFRLPDSLPPFDLARALARCEGDTQLLYRLLTIFVCDYTDWGTRLHAQLEKADMAEALRLAHTLKGCAGTLEIRELAEAASALEQALRHHAPPPQITRLLQTVEAILTPAVAAAATLIHPKTDALCEHSAAESSAHPCDSSPLSPADVMAATRLLEALRHSLSSDIKQALKQTQELEALLAHTNLAAEIQAVSDAMNVFETDTALAGLKRLAEKMVATTGGNHA